MHEAEKEPEYYSFCRMCGLPFTTKHIGGTIKGFLIDWQGHKIREVYVTICDECRDKLDQFDLDGMDGALDRRRTMNEVLEENKIKHDV